MDCPEIQEQLSAFVDARLDGESSAIVEAHLAVCAPCRAEKEALVSLDAALRRTLQNEQRRVDVVAERVMRQLGDTAASSSAAGQSVPAGRRFVAYLIAAAAGFLLAAGLLFPWRKSEPPKLADPERKSADQTDTAIAPLRAVAVAQLLLATGPVMVRPQGEVTWVSLQKEELPSFTCPSDSSVKTEPGALCELKTSSGSRVRMNESCEIALRSEDELELVQGQIWCRTADAGVLRVVTGQRAGTGTGTGAGTESTAASTERLTLVCPNLSESFASCSTEGPMQVVAAEGTVDVTVNGRERSLKPGSFCTVSGGEINVRESTAELLREESWMQPLLTLAGHGNAELTERVNALLANLGRTKLSVFYEQDLRSLGEYAALPLLKFVQSDESRQQPARRQKAMRIVMDTAPVWMIPDLISLLEDDDATIRSQSAQSLERLTGQSQGLTAADWQADRPQWSQGVDGWQAWWNQYRFSCAPPPGNVTPTRSP